MQGSNGRHAAFTGSSGTRRPGEPCRRPPPTRAPSRPACTIRRVSLTTFVLLGLEFLLALPPTRRMWHGGARPGQLVGYLALLLLLGALAIEARPLARYTIPILVALYLFPYLGLGARWQRWRSNLEEGGTGSGGATVIEGHANRIDPTGRAEPGTDGVGRGAR